MKAGAMSKDNKIAGTYEVSPAAGYAGDVAPATAWKILSENKDAVLIDVRTRPEWNYVGLPTRRTLARNRRCSNGRSSQLQPPGIRGRAFGRPPRQKAPLHFITKWSSIGRGGESSRGRTVRVST
jgi:hypothetical protein